MSHYEVERRMLRNGGPWWWRDALYPFVVPFTETRWVAGVKYTRIWNVDGTFTDQVGLGKAITSDWSGWPR